MNWAGAHPSLFEGVGIPRMPLSPDSRLSGQRPFRKPAGGQRAFLSWCSSFVTPLLRFFPHAPGVTSNLDSRIQRADHRQGGGGRYTALRKGPKSLVIKILRTLFAKAAPVKPFRGGGRGGYPLQGLTLPKPTSPEPRLPNPSDNFFFVRCPQAILKPNA